MTVASIEAYSLACQSSQQYSHYNPFCFPQDLQDADRLGLSDNVRTPEDAAYYSDDCAVPKKL